MDTAGAAANTTPAGPCARIPAGQSDFVREILDRVGDKWTLLVIATLQHGVRRYSDLQHTVPGISQRMLTLTLRQLVQDGLITRTAYAEVPPRVEYALTPLGISLLDIVGSLIDWASTHHDEIRDHRTRFGQATTKPTS
ncbi:winged helix-turn-helix transcriptional regulator [Streptomyces graminofaciens]|nr:helix-turn-helix domain-containing protein [Streptomyces graminofaciens]